MIPDNLKSAIRVAVRLHEIGNSSPYRISFARKGKSGASFGYMQGDLATGQHVVETTFRRALERAGIPADTINVLFSKLSRHVLSNPLSDEDTKRVNSALHAASDLVDAMDEEILSEVFDDLEDCLRAAREGERRIQSIAMIYIALWINMSGHPTSLLGWLRDGKADLSSSVPEPSGTVGKNEIESYLLATDYYRNNPRNFSHLSQCVAAGMKMLKNLPAEASGPASALAADATAKASISLNAQASNGDYFTVTFTRSGANTGQFTLLEKSEISRHAASYEVHDIRAAQDGSVLVCIASGFRASINCMLLKEEGQRLQTLRISITGSPFGIWDNTTDYTTKENDFLRLQKFIVSASFPDLYQRSRPAYAASLAATSASRDDSDNIYSLAASAVEMWSVHKSSEIYDEEIAPLIVASASRVRQSGTELEFAQWLEVQSAAFGISDEEITETTLHLHDMEPDMFRAAFERLGPSQRARLQIILGEIDELPGEALAAAADTEEAARGAALAAAADSIRANFEAERVFRSARGFPVAAGTLRLSDRTGAQIASYRVNTGGGAKNYRTTNGPIPPGVYRVSSYRARTTVGMVLDDVGYSFNLDPVFGTPVFGRSLFRIHPDGGSEQTNGCLGVRESAANLIRCRDELRALMEEGKVNVSVSYKNVQF